MNSSFWLELLVRSAALLLAAEVLRRTLAKRQGAALRHRLLLLTFCLLALLPVLSVLLPEIDIPLWTPLHRQPALVTIRETPSTILAKQALHRVNWPLAVWLAGVFLASLPLFIGTLSARRLSRRAVPCFTPALEDALDKLRPLNSPQILLTADLPVPLTSGFLRPRILLPAAAEHWSSQRLQAVLSHEMAHVRRHDVAAQVATHLVASLWWFQPLVWLERRALRAESEIACDAEALHSGFRPSDYAAELLAVARSLDCSHKLPLTAISMARSGSLEDRLRAILNPPAALLSPPRSYALPLLLALIAISASAVTLHLNQNSNEQGGSIMKRTILSALLTSAGLSAATISGSIHDAGGNTLPDVKLFLSNPDTGAKQEATTSSQGSFSFTGTAAGQYILRAEKPGFSSLFREFDLKADSTMDREFVMSLEGDQPVADKLVDTNEAQPKPITVGGKVAQNNLTTKVQPIYPPAAKSARTQGTVDIETTISKDGVPMELRVVSSPSDDLSESALEAVRQWRYRPTLLNGAPVEIVTHVIVNYTLLK